MTATLEDILAILQKAKTPMRPFIPTEPAPEAQSYLVTVEVKWSISPYVWTSPYDRSGEVERTILVNILQGETINEEIKRLVQMELEKEFVKMDFEFEVIGIEKL